MPKDRFQALNGRQTFSFRRISSTFCFQATLQLNAVDAELQRPERQLHVHLGAGFLNLHDRMNGWGAFVFHEPAQKRHPKLELKHSVSTKKGASGCCPSLPLA